MRLVAGGTALGLVLVLVLALGCDGTNEAEARPPAATRAAETRPALPRFQGVGVDGEPVSTDLFRRKRGLILLFSERDRGGDEMAELVGRIRFDAEKSNVAFMGVSRDANADDGQAFARRHKLDFPLLWDPSQATSRKLRAPAGEAALVVIDGDGSILLAFSGINPEVGVDTYEQAVRDALRLSSDADAVKVSYGVRPDAPEIAITDLEGKPHSLADFKDKVVVLVFFLHTCPHCHEALAFLDDLASQLEGQDLAIVSVSVQNKPDAVKGMRAAQGLDLPLFLDADDASQKAYAFTGGVPETVILDKNHKVIGRHSGFEPRIQALMTMSIRNALGVENPILLVRDGYSGQDTCSVCHANQHDTWSLTSHAYAFDTLVEHGEARNAECLPCHTVGWDQPGGYSLKTADAHLEGVQCENCHGRGGPHQSPDFVKAGFENACASCHNPEHSLQFSFGERLPLVSHAANQQFANLSLEERRALLEKRDKRSRKLFDRGEFVGSDQCQSCHSDEHTRWSTSAHARAFTTLEDHGEAKNKDCQQCHTTGFGETGGFPDGGSGLVNVGCESCHGPGSAHVAEGARRDGTILALTDKCDSCVVLQICGSCHDDANDPGFEFEVLDKIDLIRHGFREQEGAAE